MSRSSVRCPFSTPSHLTVTMNIQMAVRWQARPPDCHNEYETTRDHLTATMNIQITFQSGGNARGSTL